jgi:hypothetical protein
LNGQFFALYAGKSGDEKGQKKMLGSGRFSQSSVETFKQFAFLTNAVFGKGAACFDELNATYLF